MKYLLLILLCFTLACEKQESKKVEKTKRIITIGSNATEIIFGLGLGDSVIARDYASDFPAEAVQLPALGQAHKINVEALLEHNPSHIVVWDHRGTYEGLILKAKKAGLQVLELEVGYTVDICRNNIKKSEEFFKLPGSSKELLSELNKDIQELDAYKKEKGKTGKAVFIYTHGLGTSYVAGKNTNAEGLFKLAGLSLAIDGFESFKPVNAETIIEANPQYIVLLHKGIESLGGVDKVGKIPGLQKTDAIKNKNVIALEDAAMKFGPRVGKFALELCKKVNGDIAPASR